ncbi:hypothetical protein AB0I28_24600 [Phytomonospora sp. NPDC050363]|uniref:hypothetical protein n=1 Tax=Phytomonospora sp. NPDC050363 TaxID=3155642 RepID=UPI0033FAA5C5
MNRVALIVPLLFAAALLTACENEGMACGAGAVAQAGTCKPVPPEQYRLDAEVVEFVPDHRAGRFPGSIADAPIDVALLHGWNTGTEGGDAEPRDPATALDAAAEPGMKYVALSASTGCRLTESVELYLRGGNELVARFEGGEDHQECVRAHDAYAQFAVPAEQVAGALYVEGAKPVAPEGPGVLSHFVPLGVLDASAAGIEPIRLGGDTGGELREALLTAGAADEPLREALADPPADYGGLAFVLDGCAEDGAKLLLGPRVISAELTGDDDADCEVPAWFLAVFTVENAYAQWDARLAIFGR